MIRWAEAAWGRRIVGVRPLAGGWTSTILAVTAAGGDRAVLRLMAKEPWRRHAPAMVRREAETQRQLAGGPVPAPVSIALDPAGAVAGVPAHLMSWLPGAVDLGDAGDAGERLVGRLADVLVAVHRHDPGAVRPRAYQSWAFPAKRLVPGWSARPRLWERAFRELDGPGPEHAGVFLHRDFHLGNVLWRDGVVSGVVDWVETSWGPAGLDVAHAATYLAMVCGGSAAAAFTAAYRVRAGGVFDVGAQRYWEIMDTVGYLPDPSKVTRPWRDLGRAVSDEVACARLEGRLASVLG